MGTGGRRVHRSDADADRESVRVVQVRAGELSARRGLPFQDYTDAVRNLARIESFPRKMVIHDHVDLDPERVIEALDRLDPVEEFIAAVTELPDEDPGRGEAQRPRAA